MQPRELRQDIGETDLSYLLYDGEGPPLVLLHATGFLPWIWHPVARSLAPSWRVIVPYFCDHRMMNPDDGGLSWTIVANDLAVFCSRLGLERPALVGHSMGATVLTLAHALYGLESRGMVLIEPIFLPRDLYRMQMSLDQHPLASRALRRKNHWDSRREALAYLRERPLFRKWDEEVLDLYIRYGMRENDGGGLSLTCSPAREASLFMGSVHHDPWPALSKISCPVLVLEGEESENRAFIDLGTAASLIPDGSYRMIEKAGHLIPMEQPGEVARITRKFFNRRGNR